MIRAYRLLLPSGLDSTWFEKPGSMPPWLYKHFKDVIGTSLQQKDGRNLLPPLSHRTAHVMSGTSKPTNTTQHFWVYPPEPVFDLVPANQRFDPASLFMSRIFLRLPHFFVKLLCPLCDATLEKSGIACPRRIVDMEDCVWIVTWRYRCTKQECPR